MPSATRNLFKIGKIVLSFLREESCSFGIFYYIVGYYDVDSIMLRWREPKMFIIMLCKQLMLVGTIFISHYPEKILSLSLLV